MTLKLKKVIYHILWIGEQLVGTKNLTWSQFRENFKALHLTPFNGSPNRFAPIEIIDINYLNEDFIKNLPSDRPLVFRGLINQTECLQKWSWPYLKNTMGEIEQPFVDTFSEANFNSGVKQSDKIIESIVSENPQFSIIVGDILDKKPELVKDLQVEKWVDLSAFKFKLNKSWQFFAAGKKRNTNLHSELGSVLSLQILGEKTWTVFSTKYSVNVSPKVNWKMYIESNYYSDFSKFKNQNLGIVGFEVLLKPGDVLYYPSFFWHYVTNETASAAVSFKWTEPLSFLRHPFLSLCIITSRNPSALFRLPGLKKLSKINPPVG
jgi:hypothetical protein